MSLEKDHVFVRTSTFDLHGQTYTFYPLSQLESQVEGGLSRLPFSIKVILEAALREYDGRTITKDHVMKLANWVQQRDPAQEVPFKPYRILLHDTTGIPAIVDLAMLRDKIAEMDEDVSDVNPLIPVDLVVDHSVMVDYAGTMEARDLNEAREFQRNEERFRFLKWAQATFKNLRVFPPSSGIMHQINLEYLATVVATKKEEKQTLVFPDSLVGTDSHTTMINGLGIVGYGVGGIEAESRMLGEPLYFGTPEVVGFKLTGSLPEGTTATDLALTITNLLREKGVVGKFVEFYGEGVSSLSLFDRSTIANMAPEYGATMGFFPVDEEVLRYLRFIGHDKEHIDLVESYYKSQGMFYHSDQKDPLYSDYVELDLSSVVSCLAGPKRPQDRIDLKDMKSVYRSTISKPVEEGGYGLSEEEQQKKVVIPSQDNEEMVLRTGDVVIAAITSCTNTSNPNVLIGAGLVAKKALEKGLRKPLYVKSSLTPGSKVVTDYLRRSGMLPYLEAYGFHVAGYGCATCIGNSGDFSEEVDEAITNHDLTVASVLSGNRNFEGRVHPKVKANYLASPPLVVAYALAGTVNIDMNTEPLGFDHNHQPVYLKDIWPTSKEIEETLLQALQPDMFQERYKDVFLLNERWNQLDVPVSEQYDWDPHSTYIQSPPFLETMTHEPGEEMDIKDARVLAKLGDSVTTDHLSPSGSIKTNSPSGKYLKEKGIGFKDFNSYPSRRGNHEVMMRGAFGNVRVRNQLTPEKEGGFTKYMPTGEVMSIYDAAMKYQKDKTNLIVIAGKEYGTGSSRDWAAKGPYLLGVRAVLAESFERIHRSNLVGMGILPLQFKKGENTESLELTGHETFDLLGLSLDMEPGEDLTVVATCENGTQIRFDMTIRLDNIIEVQYYRNGGILPTMIKKLTDTEVIR